MQSLSKTSSGHHKIPSQTGTVSIEQLKQDYEQEENRPAVTVSEYRKLLNDYSTADEKIIERLRYIEMLCRYVIREEITNYVDT